ncbi:DUF7483 domain-containing protein [Vreelandella neptunia]|uniref:DUF7483 domain-containing protein n=1 Tax=Vreelandella neptunia TaxID=115551 RepID=UPI00315A24CB
MRIPKKALLLAVKRGLDVSETFSTTLYTGNGGTQTITNGIDLAGEGGLVWTKRRDATGNHAIVDTVRGPTPTSGSAGNGELYTNSTAAAVDSDDFDAYLSDGFRLRFNTATSNSSGASYASWTFRQAPKFFDIVQYTGDGTSGRQIAHDLGVAPGMIVVKNLINTTDWRVWHRGAGAAHGSLNLADAFNTNNASVSSVWGDGSSYIEPTASSFTIGSDGGVNTITNTYIAYVFAHDVNDSGIIQCGSYTGNGSTQQVDLGWEPQFIISKVASAAGSWLILDSARGFSSSTTESAILYTNLSNAEFVATGDIFTTNATGFEVANSPAVNTSGNTYIYCAIKAPE